MCPSLGAINQNLLMSSDYFIVPTAPDYFSSLAITSLSNVLPRWIEWGRRSSSMDILRTAAYPFKEPSLKFLGTIVQKYRPRGGRPSAGFQEWINRVASSVNSSLAPVLDRNGVMLDRNKYEDLDLLSKNYCLAEIPDFNTLIATSQTHRTPIFALTDSMFGHGGTVLAQDQQKRAEFATIFLELANRVIALTS